MALDPSEAVARLGVEEADARTSLSNPEREAAGETRGGGMFVRGSRGGGSPWLNVASRLAGVLAVIALVGLGWGGWWVVGRMATPGGGAGPIDVEDNGLVCGAVDARGTGAFFHAPEILFGHVTLPDQGRVRSRRDEQGRVDYYAPREGQMAVFHGPQGHVRSVSLRFDEPVEMCDALGRAGLVRTRAELSRDVDGTMRVMSGGTGLMRGGGSGIRLIYSPDGRIEALRIER